VLAGRGCVKKNPHRRPSRPLCHYRKVFFWWILLDLSAILLLYARLRIIPFSAMRARPCRNETAEFKTDGIYIKVPRLESSRRRGACRQAHVSTDPCAGFAFNVVFSFFELHCSDCLGQTIGGGFSTMNVADQSHVKGLIPPLLVFVVCVSCSYQRTNLQRKRMTTQLFREF
jgi:hypothetical protein